MTKKEKIWTQSKPHNWSETEREWDDSVSRLVSNRIVKVAGNKCPVENRSIGWPKTRCSDGTGAEYWTRTGNTYTERKYITCCSIYETI